MLNKNERVRVRKMAADARKSLKKSSMVGISVLNYDLKATSEVLERLKELSGADSVSSDGFMGYVHFSKKRD